MLKDSNIVKSKEAEMILKDFASRQRVHVNIPIHLSRLYQRLYQQDKRVNREALDRFFKDLESLGYGKLDVNTRGYKIFKPNRSIKAIGLEVFPDYKPSPSNGASKDTPPVSPLTRNVIVLFRLHGLRCRAEIPEETLQDFEKLVNQ